MQYFIEPWETLNSFHIFNTLHLLAPVPLRRRAACCCAVGPWGQDISHISHLPHPTPAGPMAAAEESKVLRSLGSTTHPTHFTPAVTFAIPAGPRAAAEESNVLLRRGSLGSCSQTARVWCPPHEMCRMRLPSTAATT